MHDKVCGLKWSGMNREGGHWKGRIPVRRQATRNGIFWLIPSLKDASAGSSGFSVKARYTHRRKNGTVESGCEEHALSYVVIKSHDNNHSAILPFITKTTAAAAAAATTTTTTATTTTTKIRASNRTTQHGTIRYTTQIQQSKSKKQNKNKNSKKANAKALGLTVTMNNASVEQATVLSVWKIDQQTRELNAARKTSREHNNEDPSHQR